MSGATATTPARTVAGSADHAGGMSGLARRGLGSLLGAGIGAVATFVLTVVVTRGAAPAEAGVFFVATSLFLVLASLCALGTQTGLVYFVARSGATDGYRLVRGWLRVALPPVVVVSLLVGAVLAGSAEWVGRLVDAGAAPGESESLAGFLRLLAVALPLVALYEALVAATQGFHTVRPTTLVERIGRPALQLVLVTGALLAGGGLLLPLAWVAPYAALLVVVALWLRALLRTGAGAAPADRAVGDARRFWSYTGPRGLAGLGQIALQRLDIVLVAVLLDAVSAAVYTAATRFVALSQLGNNAVAQAVQPKLAALLAVGDRAAARTVYQTATAWVVIATWPIHLAVIAAAPYVVTIFGPGYGGAEPVVVLLAGAMLVATGCGMVTVVLVMAGKTWWNLANIGVALVVTIALDLVLVPRIGIIGAGIGWAAALVIGNLLPLWQIWRHLGLHPFGRATGLAYGIAATCFGLVPLLGRLLGGRQGALTGLGAGLIVYVVWVWRERRGLGLSELARSAAASNESLGGERHGEHVRADPEGS